MSLRTEIHPDHTRDQAACTGDRAGALALAVSTRHAYRDGVRLNAGGAPLADRKSFWAWCLESEEPSDADRAALAAKLSKRYGTEITAKPVPSLGDAELRAPRIGVARLGGRLVLHDDLRPGPLRLRRPLHRADQGLQP